MMLVIDASVTIAWCVPDETSSYADRAMAKVLEGGGLVPSLWFLEVSNILVLNERKGRLSAGTAVSILEDLSSLHLVTDPETASRAFQESTLLAQKHQLTVYDASYLELARRSSLPIASLDKDLMKAARAEGLICFA